MQEILFRGFHHYVGGATTITLNGKKVEGEWVQGLLPFRNYIRVFIPHEWFDEGEKREYATTEDVDVLSQTVRQYTGLYDKNGNKIFEGDILKACHNDRPYSVKFIECSLRIKDIYGCEIRPTQEALDWFEVEVIGNVFENAEVEE